MQIRLLTSRSGIDFSQHCGEVIEVDDATASRMIEAGQAEAAVVDPRAKVIERAVVKPRREKAVK